jgi:hypothetical protein
LALTIAPLQGGAAMAGLAAGIIANNAVASPGGLPVSWSALGAGAIGAATPAAQWQQARFAVSGKFGSYGSLIIEGSNNNASWFALAGISDPTQLGYGLYAGYGGLTILTPSPGVVVLAVTDANMDRPEYLRVRVANGDGTTSVNVSGNVSIVGAV